MNQQRGRRTRPGALAAGLLLAAAAMAGAPHGSGQAREAGDTAARLLASAPQPRPNPRAGAMAPAPAESLAPAPADPAMRTLRQPVPLAAAGGCRQDLAAYRGQLQNPAPERQSALVHVREVAAAHGGARAATRSVRAELEIREGELESELARRNPFDLAARAEADQRIAIIEDDILIATATLAALNCLD